MTITKRTLTKWRKEALKAFNSKPLSNGTNLDKKPLTEILSYAQNIEIANRILQMTQELLDQHLMREVDKDN